MSQDPLRRQFHRLADEDEHRELGRHLNLAVVLQDHNGRDLYWAGGEWDRLQRRYTGRYHRAHRIRLRASQIAAAQHALYWLQEKKAGRPRDFSALFLIGDRGGGKTALASIIMGLAVLEFPAFDGSPTIAWQISKSHEERDELDRYLREFFPFEGSWYTYSEYRGHKYRFAHGPTLTNVSADDAETLKRGRVDFSFYNEASKYSKKVPAYGLGRLKDKGGFSLFTSNRPTERSRWILQWHEKAEEAKAAGTTYPVRFVTVASAGNDMLDRDSAGQISTLVNDIAPDLADDDLGSLFDRRETIAYPKFHKAESVAPPPDLGDITRAFTLQKTGIGYDFVGSADFQYNPGIVATIWKIYGTKEDPVLWALDEIEVPHASEEEFLAEVLETTLYTPANTLWTGDNTGQIQNGRHDPKDRTSFAVWKDRGWRIVPNVKPKDRDHRPNNARVERRMGLTNFLLAKKSSLGCRQIMISPKCPRLIHALKECELKTSGKNGLPYPAHPFSHITDTLGYLAWWAWPKPGRCTPTGSLGESVDIPRPKVW